MLYTPDCLGYKVWLSYNTSARTEGCSSLCSPVISRVTWGECAEAGCCSLSILRCRGAARPGVFRTHSQEGSETSGDLTPKPE